MGHGPGDFHARRKEIVFMPSEKPQTVLILQGGGALGSYQGGAVEGLIEHGVDFDWVVGTSIGAINGALIAGNPPEKRLQNLQAFWDHVAFDHVPLQSLMPFAAPWLQSLDSTLKTMGPLLKGVRGFFAPRPGSLLNPGAKLQAHEVGFYDTSQLETTLNRLVDFDYLNSGNVRYCACAVHVPSGKLAVFDTTEQPITAKHVMASGALPPGFPPVVIDGEAYWDGGIYSNTPMDIVLDDAERCDALCFMIDLRDPTESTPSTINDAMTRLKDIQYASRSHEQIDTHAMLQNMRRAIRILHQRLSDEEREHPDVKRLEALGCGHTINIVRIIMKALADDNQSKDIDFSRATVDARWAAGRHDVERVFQRKSWLDIPPDHIGLIVHELEQE